MTINTAMDFQSIDQSSYVNVREGGYSLQNEARKEQKHQG